LYVSLFALSGYFWPSPHQCVDVRYIALEV
jgi:hypothetical protein